MKGVATVEFASTGNPKKLICIIDNKKSIYPCKNLFTHAWSIAKYALFNAHFAWALKCVIHYSSVHNYNGLHALFVTKVNCFHEYFTFKLQVPVH